MKSLTTVVYITLAWSCLLPFALGQLDRYKMSIKEKEAKFQEDIDINEKENFEVFRVPAHNNIEGADFYHDFNMNVTVTRVLSRKVCYIAKMDSSMSSPGKLKMDLDRAASLPRQLPVTTKMSMVMVTGFANRLLLTQEILDFCGALPIYKTEVFNTDASSGNGSAIIPMGRRYRRLVISKFKNCLQTEGKNIFTYVISGGCFTRSSWNLQCKMIPRFMHCFYYASCIRIPRAYDWNCTSVHESSQNPVCCDFVC